MARVLLGGYAVSAATLVLLLLIARLLGAQKFSSVAAGLALGAFFVPILDMGSERTFARDVLSKFGHGLRRVVAANWRRRTRVAGWSIGAIGCASFLFADSVTESVAIFVFAAWVAAQGFSPSAWFDFIGKTSLHNEILLVERTVSVVLVVALGWRAPSVATEYVGASILVVRLLSLIIQFGTWRQMQLRHQDEQPDRIPEELSGTDFRVALALSMTALLSYGNQLILEANRPAEEVSSYSMLFQLLSVAFIFQSQLARIGARDVAESLKSPSEFWKSFRKSALHLTLGSAVISLCIAVVVTFMQTHLLGGGFLAAGDALLPLMVWVVVLGFGLAINQHNLALGAGSFYLWAALTGGLASIALGSVVVPSYGAMGAATVLLAVHSLMITANGGWLVRRARRWRSTDAQ